MRLYRKVSDTDNSQWRLSRGLKNVTGLMTTTMAL
jgi:hypothetical protein